MKYSKNQGLPTAYSAMLANFPTDSHKKATLTLTSTSPLIIISKSNKSLYLVLSSLTSVIPFANKFVMIQIT